MTPTSLTNGPQHNLRGHVLPDIQPYMQAYMHTYTVPVTHQGYHPGALDNFYRVTD
jgi:hypothetical protein